jgi:hypothetical protein
MAIDSIPATIEKEAIVRILCGAGGFPFPDVSRVPSNIQVVLIGDLSSPALSLPTGSAVFSKIAGKRARWRANVGPYAAVITDGSHWIHLDTTSFGQADQGLVVTASASPNLDIVSLFDWNSLLDTNVYPYNTVFEVSPDDFTGAAYGPLHGGSNIFKNVAITGIEIAGSNAVVKFKNIDFYACKFSVAAGLFNFSLRDGWFQSYSDTVSVAAEGSVTFSASYFKTSSVTARQPLDTIMSNSVIANQPLVTSPQAAISVAECDFEGSGDSVRMLSSSSVLFFGDCSIEPTKSTFINGSSALNTSVDIQGGLTMTGSVTGNAITLVKGSQATGVENACSGTLTAGGSEIVVGGNGGQTFASLPATDLGAASPQLCRAD